MGKVVSIKIIGSGADNDAPTADDLLDQLRDCLAVMKGVEEAIDPNGRTAIEWRVINVTKNSPLQFEFEAYPKDYGTDITHRVTDVIGAVAHGFEVLRSTPFRPPYFTDEVLGKMGRIYERITNGLASSEINFGAGIAPQIIVPAVARSAVRNVEIARKPVDKPYKEMGSIEGYTQGAELDGYGRRLVYIKHRVSGVSVKCVVTGQALARVGGHFIADIYKGLRVTLRGVIHYKSLGVISFMEANEIIFSRRESELPAVDDILNENFTKGLSTEDYLKGIRDGFSI